MASIINASTSGAGGVITTADASGELQLQSGGNAVVSFTNTGGTAPRITGDFTNATIANRVLFQTNVSNGETSVGIIPNGTANLSGISIYSTSDPTNASRLRINVNANGDGINISSGAVGTGTNLPLRLQIGATNQAILQTNGDFAFNSGYGSAAVAYGCRAWVNFDGTGTVAIRASGNVSSITDDGTGDYSVNFTNAMPDANYALTSSSVRVTNPYIIGWTSSTTSLVKVRAVNTTTNTLTDVMDVMIAIFR
jgi:hypothetical protein